MGAALQWGAGEMFKLTFFLCAGLYAAMFFGGANHGQQRFGLMEQPSAPETPAARAVQVAPVVADVAPQAATPVVASLTQAAFVPEAPLMAATPAVVTPASTAETSAPDPVPGVVMVVNTKSANVRSGPGQDFDVVDRLGRGESVLVVAQGEGADGWSLIRIEGDGIEGYIASRLLTE